MDEAIQKDKAERMDKVVEVIGRFMDGYLTETETINEIVLIATRG